MGLEYNFDEKQLVSVFHQYRNDINIYTEDCDKDKSFYQQLLGRLMDNTDCQIADIFPIGDCDSVEKASKESPDERGFYLMDGDIYVIYAPRIRRSNLFVLDSYCIENYVIDEESVSKLVFELNGGKETLEAIKEKINFHHAFDVLLQPILNLFFVMSLERKYAGAFELLKYDNFISKGKIYDANKVQEAIDDKQTQLVPSVISDDTFVEDLKLLRELYPYNNSTLLQVVSGKDYLLPYLKRYINQKIGFNFQLPKESWKYNLAKYCNLERLTPLKKAILMRLHELEN